MKNLVLILSAVFISGLSFSQDEMETMPYIQGEILIMIDDPANLNGVIQQFQYVQGANTELSVKQEVSKPGHIWLLGFNHMMITHVNMLEALKTNIHVVIAQNNHIVQERATTPNDPQFGSQWHHIDGSDNDIDSDLAWDTTTGGLTANGDEIVVCVLEGGGADWDHPDLLANHWTNTAEIPSNGVDDDGNGYIDDVNGWNTGTNNDVIASGGHGTNVSGMIGAVGDNNSVVAGINWNVKIMQVDMASGLSESNVIAAYTYPLVMRQMYNWSGGTEGAFVVATNASWGIDNGDPSSAPLWCAFYDTLGAYGILNCGATANNNVNIDVVGDLPTACGSDYMISVTATNSSDVRTFSGYGQTTIDLGAPGESVVTTSNGGGSTSTSGTSFASPLTAGVIALMYSTNCTDLADMALTSPEAAANVVRTALLDGVDPVSNLTTECVTGGRLNANNSVNLILSGCGMPVCTATYSYTVTNETCVDDCDGEITVTASGGSGSFTFDIGSGAGAPSTFSGLCDGDYSIFVDDGDICQETLNITVGGSTAALSATGSITDETVSNDGIIIVSVNGGSSPYSYAWTGPGGYTSTALNIGSLEPGTYSLTITDAYGCTFTDDYVVGSQVGVDENQIDFKIYPNPANDQLNLILTENGDMTFQLYDNLGRIVLTESVNGTSQIDVSELSGGIYHFTITSNNGETSQGKLVIE